MTKFVRAVVGFAWVVALVLPSAPARAACLSPPGDVNGSGDTSVVDVQCLIIVALWNLGGADPATYPACAAVPASDADIDCDGSNTVVDVQIAIANALGMILDPAVDSNGNGCVDVCEVGMCGNGVCEPSYEDCDSCPADCGKCDCCTEHGSPGCANAGCESCVCNTDSVCCDMTWDVVCHGIAASICSTECGCINQGNCCTPQVGPGCGDDTCESCVCSLDDSCCNVQWDDVCAAIALGTCAERWEGTATATGAGVVPPTSSTATATANFVIVGDILFWLVIHDVANPTAAHIHAGAPGENGPVIVDLGDATNPISGSMPLSQAIKDTLTMGDAYLQIHSTDYPSGEIRGPVSISPSTPPCTCAQ